MQVKERDADENSQSSGVSLLNRALGLQQSAASSASGNSASHLSVRQHRQLADVAQKSPGGSLTS